MLYLKEGRKPLSAVIFDLGNTLLDYAPSRIALELGIPGEHVARFRQIVTDRPEWDEYNRGTLCKEDIQRLALRDEPGWSHWIKTYLRHWWEHMPAITENVGLFYRIKAQGVRTYILSNYMRDGYEYMAQHNSFISDFNGAIVSYACQLNKPDPAIFRLLLDTYPEIEPARTLFFDDNACNTDAAKSFGFLAVNQPKNALLEPYLEFCEN